MAKKLSMKTCVLGVAVLLVLVYFFRPQAFSFLMEGFADNFDPDSEGFKGESGKKDSASASTSASTPPPTCVPGCVPQ